MKTAVRRILFGKNRNTLSPVDPFLNDIVLYLKGDGANNGTVFTDSSQYNHAISRFGVGNNIVTSNTQSKYGGSSLYSPTNAVESGLEIPNNSVFNIGTKDYTIEFWYYKTSDNFQNNLTEIFTLDGLDFPLTVYDGVALGSKPALYTSADSIAWTVNVSVANTVISLNQWNHVCFCRKAGFLRGFLNGNLFQSVADISSVGSGTANPSLMSSRLSGFYGAMLGYIDNFRFTMAGRYGASFNAETDTFMS